MLIIFLFIFLLLNSKLFGKSLGLHFILIMIVSFGGIIATSIILIIDIKKIIKNIYHYYSGNSKKQQECTYLQLMKEYNANIEIYNFQLNDYLNAKKEEKLPYYIEHYREKMFYEHLKKSKHPEPILNSNFNLNLNIKKGPAEIYFYNYLNKLFDENIYIDFYIDYCLTYQTKVFYPDLIIWHRITNIIIDIEIDEPYVGDTGEPIHYQIDNSNVSFMNGDMDRNFAFNDCGWFVIRFAEEQVFKYPKQCYDYICSFIKIIRVDKIHSYKNIDFFAPRIKKWSFDEAQKLYLNKFRQTYIKQK